MAEESLLQQGLRAFPVSAKMWLMLGQLHERRGAAARAGEAYQAGLRRCPTSVPLWLAAAAAEGRASGLAKARTLLEAARLRLPKAPELWIEAIRLERRAAAAAAAAGGAGPSAAGANAAAFSSKLADVLMSKALQELPLSGRLLAEDICTAPRAEQKRKSLDALKKCDSDANVVLAVARLFWRDRKYDKARKWFERAVSLQPSLGDAWAWLYAFEAEQAALPGAAAAAAAAGDGRDVGAAAREALARAALAEPTQGELFAPENKRVTGTRRALADVLRAVAAGLGPTLAVGAAAEAGTDEA